MTAYWDLGHGLPKTRSCRHLCWHQIQATPTYTCCSHNWISSSHWWFSPTLPPHPKPIHGDQLQPLIRLPCFKWHLPLMWFESTFISTICKSFYFIFYTSTNLSHIGLFSENLMLSHPSPNHAELLTSWKDHVSLSLCVICYSELVLCPFQTGQL